jgi:hypothetical protein
MLIRTSRAQVVLACPERTDVSSHTTLIHALGGAERGGGMRGRLHLTSLVESPAVSAGTATAVRPQ